MKLIDTVRPYSSKGLKSITPVGVCPRLLVSTAMVLFIGSLLVACDSNSSASQNTVTTSMGSAQGTTADNGTLAFLGLPFAEPPTGDRRFKPPVSLSAWPELLDATDFGPACPQGDGSENNTFNIDENCLTLNVWTPAIDGGARPVMVWIHGGGWTEESAADLLYHGDVLAARGDVVVVSVEYRLGAFGFSYFADIPGSGNAGLLDQVLALQWVQDHIAAFGGDPDNVTVFGESAGGMSVSALLGMPQAQGLFHKAILQSNTASLARTASYGAAVTKLLFDAAGTTDIETLQSLTWKQFIQHQNTVMNVPLFSDTLYGPVVDGEVFTQAPMRATANGLGGDIPLLLGTTKDEARLWMIYLPLLNNPELSSSLLVQFFPYAQRAVPARSSIAEVSALYETTFPDLTPNLVALAMGTDILFRLPIIRQAENQIAQGTAAYVYRFDWAPPNPGEDYPEGAIHGSELAFTMGHPDGWSDFYGDSAPQAFIDQVMDAWLAFAKTGNPNHSGLVDWPVYDTQTRSTMIFNADGQTPTSNVAQDPDAATREYWNGVAFDGIDPTLLETDF